MFYGTQLHVESIVTTVRYIISVFETLSKPEMAEIIKTVLVTG